MQSAAYGKQTERTAGAFTLVYVSRVQSHGNGIGFIDACIPEFAVDQNCEGDDRSLAIRTKLNQPQRARPGVSLALGLALTREDLRAIPLGEGSPDGGQAECKKDDRAQNARPIPAV